MAPKKQKKTTENPENVVNEQEQATQFINAIIGPIRQMQEQNTTVLNSLIQQMNANTKAIETIASRPQPPLLPPEVTKLLPSLINGIISIFTAPDVSPAAAKQGIFDDEMMLEFKKNQKSLWSISAQIQQATLDRMLTDNILRQKQVEYEY